MTDAWFYHITSDGKLEQLGSTAERCFRFHGIVWTVVS
jgi:hypothetical protein